LHQDAGIDRHLAQVLTGCAKIALAAGTMVEVPASAFAAQL
jgi:hypothetical protein